jgi:hypothetical protein
LQGFEVVLFTIFVKDILSVGVLPISFDHDGILVMLPKKIFESQFRQKDELLLAVINLTGKFPFWSKYLLKE